VDPWNDLRKRYLASGKQRLFVITLSDFDPEGQRMLHTGACCLRDDFGLKPEIAPVGVIRRQVERYGLPTMSFAKEDSSNRDWFVERNGGDDRVWELEALDPEVLMKDLEDTIKNLIDLDLFNRELAIEAEEKTELAARKIRDLKKLREVGD
jgi:hypothetical protein